MTVAYDPDLIDRLAREDDAIFGADEPPCDCTVAGPPHTGCAMCNHREAYRDALLRTQTNLAAMADQLEAAKAELANATECWHDCEKDNVKLACELNVLKECDAIRAELDAALARVKELEAEVARWKPVESEPVGWICPTCKDPRCG